MFSSYVLYDTVAIEAVYFPHNFTAAFSNKADITTTTTTRSRSEDTPYELTLRDILLHRLTERYVGRVIPSRGLCVAITDVMEYSASSVRGAAASAWLTATFGICVFAPTPGTRLKARIAQQSPAGVYLTLDLFVVTPFLVPAAMLVPGSRYHAGQRSWYLPLDTASGESEGNGETDTASAAAGSLVTSEGAMATPTVPHNKYLVGAEVVVKVVSCTVLSEEAVVAAEDAENNMQHSGNGGVGGAASSVRSFATQPSAGSEFDFFSAEGPPAIMELRGSFIGDALGPVSWFEDA